MSERLTVTFSRVLEGRFGGEGESLDVPERVIESGGSRPAGRANGAGDRSQRRAVGGMVCVCCGNATKPEQRAGAQGIGGCSQTEPLLKGGVALAAGLPIVYRRAAIGAG